MFTFPAKKGKMAKMDSIKIEGYLLYFKNKTGLRQKNGTPVFVQVAKQIDFLFCAEVSTAKQ